MEAKTDRHPLDTWLIKVDRNQSWLARQLGVCPAAVSRWLTLGGGISAPYARRIEEVSGGALDASTLLAWQAWAVEKTSAGVVPRHADWKRAAARIVAAA